MLEGARDAGETKGLIPDLLEGGLTHLQYADDTMTFLDMSLQSITNTKLMLYCFENMTGLKINYQKSEVFVIGATIEEQKTVADMFNCNIGSLPLKYLGLW
jgi:hypothetical protein